MTLKISARSLFDARTLVVKRDHVRFTEGAIALRARRFRFEEIVCVLLSPAEELSFQVGQEVFSIRTKPGNEKHQAVIAALTAGVQGSRESGGSAVRYSGLVS